mgnify:CR=1 FL=1
MNIVVDGRYQIIKRLGKGGFAHTYLAKNLAAPGKPTCVVKQLRPKVEHPRMLQLFNPHSALQYLRQILVTKTRQFIDITDCKS